MAGVSADRAALLCVEKT